MTAIQKSQTALSAIAASSMATAKYAAGAAGLNPADYADMAAVASSSTAMTAIQKSQTALSAIAASSMATAKYAAGAAGLNPADYADMAAVASSSTAMAAVRASTTAMNALVNSTVAYNALLSSPLLVRFNPANQNAWRTDTVRTGSGIFVRLVSYNAGSNWYSIDGGNSITLTAKDSKVIKAFQTSLQVCWVDYNESARGVYYIPC